MARICLKPAAWLLAAALPLLASGTAAAALPDFSGLPVLVNADFAEVDYKTNTLVYRNVVISQGAMRVSADHARATGLNFANSKWNFDGNVRINAEEHGNLRSDQAVVEFRDNHIARATITGKPAEFEQKRANSAAVARGHADEILYDVTDGTVRLTGDAWLSDGQNEISNPLLVYNIREQRVQAAAAPEAAPGGDQRVHIIIAPRAGATGKPEPGGPETPKPEAPKSEAPKPDAAKPGAAQPGSAQPVATIDSAAPKS